MRESKGESGGIECVRDRKKKIEEREKEKDRGGIERER